MFFENYGFAIFNTFVWIVRMNLFNNISCKSVQPWRPLGRVLMLYVLPIICVVGLALNVACLIVFTKR